MSLVSTNLMVDTITQKVLEQASDDAKLYIQDYSEWWNYLCEVCKKTDDISVIKYRMFLDKGYNFRPMHWIPESIFLELIKLAKMVG